MARDIRKEIHALLRDWGHDILLQRRVLESQSGIYALADNNGFSTSLERWTVRHYVPRSSTFMNAMMSEMEGLDINGDRLYFFSWDAAPKEGDRIYEEDPRYDKVTTDAQKYASTFIIDYAQPMRGKGGRIEFWVVGCSRERPT